MKERPIIFSTELIPKILDGSKTQTRRVVRELKRYLPETWDKAVPHNMYENPYLKLPYQEEGDLIGGRYFCPYGQVGDRLWVRETWNCFYLDYDGYNDAYDLGDIIKPIPKTKPEYKHCILYRTTHDDVNEHWRPSIHMPRWASRITLEITNIRVERLQEITRKDCIAEGIQATTWSIGKDREIPKTDFQLREQYPHGFKHLWNSLNPKYSWEANPWVWVIEFMNCSK